MTAAIVSFDRFVLDAANRTLRHDGAAVDVSARYLDALILLVADAGMLVTKDRFMDEVWRGIPVTDEALTQCIRTLRRVLGDDAANPRFIETVPRYGYRFVAAVDRETDPPRAVAVPVAASRWRGVAVDAGAGTLGAGVAGLIGGLFYGSVLAAQPVGPGGAGLSVLLVLTWLTLVAALVGGAGVSIGIAAGGIAGPSGWRVVGGALGGFVVGGVVKLLGVDAFDLLLGHAPGAITGAPEGLGLGAAVGVGAWLSDALAHQPLRRRAAIAATAGALGAAMILLCGGTLMGGSLDQLAHAFPDSRLGIAGLGRLTGEDGFGPVVRYATGMGEGALFGGCIVTAMALARRG